MTKQVLNSETARLTIGQLVYCALYGGKYGRIYRIEGEQQPETIQQLPGLCCGGQANVWVVWNEGGRAQSVPESIVRCCQWRIYDDVADATEVLRLLSQAEQQEAAAETARLAADARRERERAEHLAANPHLKPVAGSNWSRGRTAGHNIRKELKAAFPGVKFRVTSDHNSVRIGWTDGPTDKQVGSVVGKYQAGHFDGMTDCYDYDDDATFSDVFGGVRYVFTNREWTVAGLQKAWTEGVLGGQADEVPTDADGRFDRWSGDQLHAERIVRVWSETALK